MVRHQEGRQPPAGLVCDSASVRQAGDAVHRYPDPGHHHPFVHTHAEAGRCGRAGQDHDGRRNGRRRYVDVQRQAAGGVRHRFTTELPGNESGRAHYGDLHATDVECVGARHPDRIARQAACLLPQRHGDQDIYRQGRHRDLGRKAYLCTARRAQRQRPSID